MRFQERFGHTLKILGERLKVLGERRFPRPPKPPSPFFGGLLRILVTCVLLSNPQGVQAQKFDFEAIDKEKIALDIDPPDVIHWQVVNSESYKDGSIVVYLRLVAEGGFSLYTEQVRFTSSSGYLLKSYFPPDPKEIVDPLSDRRVTVYDGGEFILHFQGAFPFQQSHFPLSLRYIACTARKCLFPYTEGRDVSNFVKDEESPQFQDESRRHSPDLDREGKEEETFEESLASRIRAGDLGLGFVLLGLFLGGLLTNLTPCIYPMIPITIRLLAGQARAPVLGAMAYSGGIVVVYTLLGLTAALTGSVFGQYMASKSVNIIFAIIMFLLGLSMLGYGEWQWLQNLGTRFGVGKPGIRKAFLWGCGAGFIASPCTGPILATLLAYVIVNETITRSMLYLFTYSVGFSLPYVFLGSMSNKFARKPVSPVVQIFVKVLFSSVMFALTAYYLRIPLYGWLMDLSPYWESIFFALLIGAFVVWFVIRTRPLERRRWLTVIPSLLFGVGLFAGTQWFMNSDAKKIGLGLYWYKDEREALYVAQQRGSPVLIDLWAEWCEACKKMDVTTFADVRFIERAVKNRWVLLKLDVTEASQSNDAILEKYGVQSLPSTVLLSPGLKRTHVLAGYQSAAKLVNRMEEIERQ